MSSVTEGPYYLDGALVRKDITEGKAGVPLTLRPTVVDATDGCTPVKGTPPSGTPTERSHGHPAERRTR